MRIKLDLSDFVEDERKLAVIVVDGKEARTVRDVLEKIVNLFKLSPWQNEAKGQDLGLFEDEFFIHPDETSSVLEGAAIVKLKTLPAAEGKKKRRKKSKESVIELDEGPGRSNDAQANTGKSLRSSKRKRAELSEEESPAEDALGKKKKKKKQKVYIKSESESEVEEVRDREMYGKKQKWRSLEQDTPSWRAQSNLTDGKGKSQVKEVSTSTIVNLESDDSDSESEEDVGNMAVNAGFPADSVTDSIVVQMKRRKRKHNKKKDKDQTLAMHQNQYKTYPKFNESPRYNSNFARQRNLGSISRGSQGQGTHIVFDDEDSVPGCGRDVEYVATTSSPRQPWRNDGESISPRGPPNTRWSLGSREDLLSRTNAMISSFSGRTDFTRGSSGSFTSPGGAPVMKRKPPVIVDDDIEAVLSVENSLNSPRSQQRQVREDLLPLKRVSESRTASLLKINPRRKEQAKQAQEEKSLPTDASTKLNPPSPNPIPINISEDSRVTFHNLMSIENRKVPVVFPKARPSLRYPSESGVSDVCNKNTTSPRNSAENVGKQQSRMDENDDILMDAAIVPNVDTQGNDGCEIVESHSRGDKPEMKRPQRSSPEKPEAAPPASPAQNRGNRGQPYFGKVTKPRVFGAIGALLSNLKNANDQTKQDDSRYKKDEKESNNDIVAVDIPDSEPEPEKRKTDATRKEDLPSSTPNTLPIQNIEKDSDNSPEKSQQVTVEKQNKTAPPVDDEDDDDDIVHLDSDEEEIHPAVNNQSRPFNTNQFRGMTEEQIKQFQSEFLGQPMEPEGAIHMALPPGGPMRFRGRPDGQMPMPMVSPNSRMRMPLTDKQMFPLMPDGQMRMPIMPDGQIRMPMLPDGGMLASVLGRGGVTIVPQGVMNRRMEDMEIDDEDEDEIMDEEEEEYDEEEELAMQEAIQRARLRFEAQKDRGEVEEEECQEVRETEEIEERTKRRLEEREELISPDIAEVSPGHQDSPEKRNGESEIRSESREEGKIVEEDRGRDNDDDEIEAYSPTQDIDSRGCSPNQAEEEDDTTENDIQEGPCIVDVVSIAKVKEDNTTEKNIQEGLRIVDVVSIAKVKEDNTTENNIQEGPRIVDVVSIAKEDNTTKKQIQEGPCIVDVVSVAKDSDRVKEMDEAQFEKFPKMDSPPKAGEFIALKVKNNEKSGYSEYLRAHVMAVNGLKITLKYISNCWSKKTVKDDKKEDKDLEEVVVDSDEEENGNDGKEDSNVVELDWNDIHAPRLLDP